ncbi:MAG: hypothetical protein JNK24_04325 [Alphaproteobacteria bacterium]|nr:hypothetical protein [Alphaproteobacteria bacterium]
MVRKILTILIWMLAGLLLCGPPHMAYAAQEKESRAGPHMTENSMLPKGVLPQAKKPKLNLEQIDEALDVTKQCYASDYMNNHYECDCLGMKFLEYRQEEAQTYRTILLSRAQQKCPNTAGVAGVVYGQCQGWAQTSRPYDYKDFCACVANHYAKLYEFHTSDHPWVREGQLTKAYVECDQGKMLQERLQQEQKIKEAQEHGDYYKLFPGAEKQDETLYGQDGIK